MAKTKPAPSPVSRCLISSTPLSTSLSSSTLPMSPSASSFSSSCLSSPPSSSNMAWRHICLVVLIVLASWSSVTEACFIRNCPKGGKRSMETVAVGQRPCLRCGPGNTGQCVGPKICCTPLSGCHFGTQEAEVCQKENESSTPCYISGDVCGAGDSGKCVSAGICCDSDSCAMNDRCKHAAPEQSLDKGRVLRLIQRLLQSRQYD